MNAATPRPPNDAFPKYITSVSISNIKTYCPVPDAFASDDVEVSLVVSVPSVGIDASEELAVEVATADPFATVTETLVVEVAPVLSVMSAVTE